MQKRLLGIACCLMTVIVSLVSPAHAEKAVNINDPSVKKLANQLHQQYRISTGDVYRLLKNAQYLPESIQKMDTPYESKSWQEYRQHFVTAERIQAGVVFWQRHRKILAMAQEKYGIPQALIVAILGMETKYGQEQGHFRAIDALSTLAFHYPAKATFFQKELGDFIVLSRQNNLNPLALLSSYAGALGMPQFMPSSYLNYGIGFSDPGKADLFTNSNDSIFSIANFLRQKGWEPDQPIVLPAKITNQRVENILKTNTQQPIAPTRNLAEFAQDGVSLGTPFPESLNGNSTANFMEFAGENPEYWLGFNNFYVLTLYNNSDYYAMSAYLLSEAIQNAYHST